MDDGIVSVDKPVSEPDQLSGFRQILSDGRVDLRGLAHGFADNFQLSFYNGKKIPVIEIVYRNCSHPPSASDDRTSHLPFLWYSQKVSIQG